MKYSYLFLLLTAYYAYAENQVFPEVNSEDQNTFCAMQEQATAEASQDSSSTSNTNSDVENETTLNSLEAGLQKFEENIDALISDVAKKIKSILQPSLSKQIAMRYLLEHIRNNPNEDLKRKLNHMASVDLPLQLGLMVSCREGSTYIIKTTFCANYDEIKNPKKTTLQEEKKLLRFKILKARKKNENSNSKNTKLDENTKCSLILFTNPPCIECQTFISKKQFKALLEEIRERKNPISIPEMPEVESDNHDEDEEKYNAIYE